MNQRSRRCAIKSLQPTHAALLNRDALQESLKTHGIQYVFLGDELEALVEKSGSAMSKAS
ncbi:MAG: hypothetical protein R3C53_28865 [Pirellulaceae bacterium]